jgi:Helix-turn-helix of DDE superfamily endonuclease
MYLCGKIEVKKIKKMKPTIDQLKSDREWRGVLGMPENKFRNLLIMYEIEYKKEYGAPIEVVHERLGIANPLLCSYTECLFFTLFQLKSGLTYDVLGFLWGGNMSTAQRNFARCLSILEGALSNGGYMPKRSFENADDLNIFLAAETDLILDGTEFPVERPADKGKQKVIYSGKKKRIHAKS